MAAERAQAPEGHHSGHMANVLRASSTPLLALLMGLRLAPVAGLCTRTPRSGARGSGGGYRGGGGRGQQPWRPAGGGAVRDRNRRQGMGRWDDDADDSEDELDQADAIYGVSPVLTALRAERRTFHQLLIQDSLQGPGSDRPELAQVEQLAAELGVPVETRDKGRLNSMCRNRPHQGLVLRADPLEFEAMQALPPATEAGASLWLALDEVSDPQNFGALLRSAFFLGVSGVLVSAKNSCPLTPTVSKASAGAMELMEVHAARNLPRTLAAAAADGWQVVGAALERSVEPTAIDATRPTVLVLGSEGHGLRTNVLRACTDLVRIPRDVTAPTAAVGSAAGAADMVDSLNVSVAGGILLYTMLAARSSD